MANNYYQFIDATGVILPDVSTLKTGVQDEFKAALGDDIDLSDDTVVGTLVTAETLARANVLATNALIANQLNPNIAGGVFLDSIGALLGIFRKDSTSSVVSSVTVTGVPYTTIPAGSRARTAAGDLFETTADITLQASGSGTIDFQSVEAGEVACAVGALNIIVSPVLGWETVNNTTGAVLGTATQSDRAFRRYRRDVLAIQGTSTVQAIQSAIYAVDGVKSMYFQENYTDDTVTVDSIEILPHSIYACVAGGADADVAVALLNKDVGCNWNGDTSVVVTDPNTNRQTTVKFDRPEEIALIVRVTVKAGSGVSNVETIVKNAILAWASEADDGRPGLRVGGDTSPFEIGAAINESSPILQIRKVEIGLYGGSYQTTEIDVAINKLPTLTTANITVVES